VSDTAREATAGELESWDATAVDGPGGHVLQSRAWAAHRAANGWRPHHLVGPDGTRVLALDRPWPIVGGSSAYIPRGPIPDVDDPVRLGQRLAGVTSWLSERGCDVVASDAEIPADTGYRDAIASHGFRPIEEIQPSRDTMVLDLGPDAEPAAVFAAVTKQTRARIRRAESGGLIIRRYDARPPATSSDRPVVDMGTDGHAALDAFFELELATAERRRFALGPRQRFLAWWEAALRAGHLIYLEALDPSDPSRPAGGLVLYRHGQRLSTVQSSDRVELRRTLPGVLHLLRWRAIEQAIAEGRLQMDLGGADAPGARGQPRPGDPMYGLYEHKASFGARWVTMSGAHEKVVRPWRYAVGRGAARLSAAAGRRS
jgi:lipid II:glycine glycyltransferase (peptidoglycan interpeptide bridge formation enzyme)